jgi:hypothetical protein
MGSILISGHTVGISAPFCSGSNNASRRVELVDFNLKNNPRGALLLDEVNEVAFMSLIGPEIVTNWVVDYFTPKATPTERSNMYQMLQGASPVVVTNQMPVILQHDGHSRTIVGYEVDKRGVVNLITFDPGR